VLKGHVRARFVREGKVANSVNHPGAVKMIDDGVAEDGSPYLVMEHLNGLCVDDIGSRAIPLSAALNIAYQVLDVLRAAHDNGIIHRDIKPANLFVLRDGRVKVLDFGISRLHDGAEPFDSQATGSVMGTPFFMAPEQARAEASAIDTRTDLFAVGATLFTLISGQYLHTGDDSRQVMIQAATRKARSLDSVAPETPRAVIDLVAKAVAFESSARWESAQAMQEAVRQVHEALFGPIEFQALATLVLVREFRRKSHARLTRPLSLLPWASSHVDPSPLSTTLPAVAGVTKSVESPRAAANSASHHNAPSAEPPELAGWTGQVKPKPQAATERSAPFTATFSKARVARLVALAAALLAAIAGFAHFQTQPRTAAAKLPLNSDAPLPLLGHALDVSVGTATAAAWVAPPQAAAPSSKLPTLPVRSSAKAASPASKPARAPSASKPTPTTERTASAERLNVAPTLIPSLDHFAR
ncbi:MAG TPA: serine/threonine-protein kinase, partial [Polyangiaceae bacterium]